MASKIGDDAAAPPATRRRLCKDLVLAPAAGRPSDHSAGVTAPPVQVAVHRWSDGSSAIFEGGVAQTPVYQVQVIHDARPSVTFEFLAAMRALLPSWDARVESLEDLERLHMIRVVMAGGGLDRDSDKVGVKAWRIAMYASSASPANVLQLIGAFVAVKIQTLEFASTGAPELQLSLSSREHLPDGVPEGWTFAQVGSIGPHPFDAGPVRGKRHILLQVEQEGVGDNYSMLFLGNTWPFRAQLDAAGVPG